MIPPSPEQNLRESKDTCTCDIRAREVKLHYADCPCFSRPIKVEKNWEDEFREYFDKCLKPKKPTMKNLDRELCIDFIHKTIAVALKKERESLLDSLEKEVEGMRKSEHSPATVEQSEINAYYSRIYFNSALDALLEVIRRRK